MEREEPSPINVLASQASRLKRLAVKARRAWERYLGEGARGKAEDKRREMMALEAGANALAAEANRLRREAANGARVFCAKCGCRNSAKCVDPACHGECLTAAHSEPHEE